MTMTNDSKPKFWDTREELNYLHAEIEKLKERVEELNDTINSRKFKTDGA
jgi:peptidoglycan hydrolase CwlO-like protein